MSKIHVRFNKSEESTTTLPPDMDPLAYICREVELDLGKYGGEDTALYPGVKIEYAYNEWTVTVERREL